MLSFLVALTVLVEVGTAGKELVVVVVVGIVVVCGELVVVVVDRVVVGGEHTVVVVDRVVVDGELVGLNSRGR